jgi:hypothetical protein
MDLRRSKCVGPGGTSGTVAQQCRCKLLWRGQPPISRGKHKPRGHQATGQRWTCEAHEAVSRRPPAQPVSRQWTCGCPPLPPQQQQHVIHGLPGRPTASSPASTYPIHGGVHHLLGDLVGCSSSSCISHQPTAMAQTMLDLTGACLAVQQLPHVSSGCHAAHWAAASPRNMTLLELTMNQHGSDGFDST